MEWLDEKVKDTNRFQDLLKPYSAKETAFFLLRSDKQKNADYYILYLFSY